MSFVIHVGSGTVVNYAAVDAVVPLPTHDGNFKSEIYLNGGKTILVTQTAGTIRKKLEAAAQTSVNVEVDSLDTV